MSKRIRVGDVLSIASSDGPVFIQYVGRHPVYGDAIRVPLEPRSSTPTDQEMFRHSYVTFYPASLAVSRGMAEVVGSLPCEGVPRRLRRAGVRAAKGRVETWVIEEPPKADVVTRELSELDQQLPVAAIWNHELLLQRVKERWRPEMEGRG